MSKAPDETSRADGKATDGPIPGFHGITLYDKATGVGFFTYSFSDPSEKDDFDFQNTVGANVSDGWWPVFAEPAGGPQGSLTFEPST